MLQTINLTMNYATKKLFENINIKLDSGKRYGLIGANGAGKSTFLKILQGAYEPSSGEVIIHPNARLGVLGQDQYAFEDLSLKDAVLIGNKRLFDAVKEKERLYAEGDLSDEKVNERLGELEMICAEEDPMYEYEVVIEKILQDLGFPTDLHTQPMKTLTGGDKFKILLAQVLFPKPEILLLDEPTNNLDLPAIAWLEENLKRHVGTMVVISHDRHFLNTVCTHILDLDFKTIREFSGNYDDWYIASTLIAKQQEMERNKKLKEKEELENFIARFSANASKARQATSRQKQLEKLEIQALALSSRRDPSISFKPKRTIGNEALECEGISKSYGEKKVLENLSLKILPGDKIALIGANGVGKSTLCKILVEEIAPDQGTVKWGATTQRGYFPQNVSEEIKGEETLYEWLRGFDKKVESGEIRNALGRMLFSGEEQEKSINALSGGEKHRMVLSKLMLEGGNFLVLDEPSNHLDLESIVALGEALYKFNGNVICVSHDRELIDAFANRIIELVDDGANGAKVIDFHGSYEEYLTSKEQALKSKASRKDQGT
ncbi:ABC-F family ATP-binding cassette domain-containing protein [Helicobacter mustelae]|uniref:Probable ATP-binding protein YbiT n=1 Tax=Helicobacter mustelae (strain ATCC 43772 / CCUG 25715 / CIP 103759 / LMG 18044 / NCTC 12198 / R85-136P) TaxID=679897 RepID=D3UJE6_HELM1|nr:ATP-binding cassette domain-containing protein [Helicobacter mustelae]CBG40622.1 ABC transporter ATP-binding protein [Helicobacter mustelae 12198]SQH72120.1 ABC transporter ATP-binding protein [Helicobacter mustelae]